MDKQRIAAIIQQVVEATNPIPPSIVTPGARRAVERRLYGLPRLCEKLEQVGGQEAEAITLEISGIKQALQDVSRDPYYPLIPANTSRGRRSAPPPPSAPATGPPSGGTAPGSLIRWLSACLG